MRLSTRAPSEKNIYKIKKTSMPSCMTEISALISRDDGKTQTMAIRTIFEQINNTPKRRRAKSALL